MSGNQYIMKTQ